MYECTLLMNEDVGLFDFPGACVMCSHRLVYFGGYGYAAPPGHRGTFELDEMVSHCVFQSI